jgi:hypothetical protein
MVDVGHIMEKRVVVVKRVVRNGLGVVEKKVKNPHGVRKHPVVTGVVNMTVRVKLISNVKLIQNVSTTWNGRRTMLHHPLLSTID